MQYHRWAVVQFWFYTIIDALGSHCSYMWERCRMDRTYMAKKIRWYDFDRLESLFRPILSWFKVCPKHMYNSLVFILHLQLLSNLSLFILGQYIRSNDILHIRLKQDKWYLMIIKKNLLWAQLLFQSVLVLLLAIKFYCSLGLLFWNK